MKNPFLFLLQKIIDDIEFNFDEIERHEYMSPKIKNLFTVRSIDSVKVILNDPYIPITTNVYLQIGKIIKNNEKQINTDTPNLTILKLLGNYITVPSTFCNKHKKLEFPGCK